MTEQPLNKPAILPLQIGGHRSLGIFVAGASDVAVLMVSGGAQVRAGSHRMQQQLATGLQQQHISSLRFDFPGFGDAQGQPADFLQNALWLPVVLLQAQQSQPQIKHWVMFGLCDGASAILLNKQLLQQSVGLILLNPWCRAAHNHARTMVRYYYWQRLWTAEFWKKLLSGNSQPLQSLQQFLHFWWQAQGNKQTQQNSEPAEPDLKAQTKQKRSLNSSIANHPPTSSTDDFLSALLHNWSEYKKPVLLALSSDDLTAQECASLLTQLPRRQQHAIHLHTTCHTLQNANHTCSETTHFLQLQLTIHDWLAQYLPTKNSG